MNAKETQRIIEALANMNSYKELVIKVHKEAKDFLIEATNIYPDKDKLDRYLINLVTHAEVIVVKKAMEVDPNKYQQKKEQFNDLENLEKEIKNIFNKNED